jgi:hypothetical protein
MPTILRLLLLSLIALPVSLLAQVTVEPPHLISGPGAAQRPSLHWGTLNVQLTSDRPEYFVGDTLGLTVRVNRDAHLYVYTTDERGLTRQLLPNYYDENNLARANRPFRLPSSRYQLRASSQGWQTITVQAVAVEQTPWVPSPNLRRYTPQNAFPPIQGSLSGNAQQLRADVEQGWYTSQSQISAHQGQLSGPGAAQPRRGIEVAPPPSPSYGEATQRILVRGSSFNPNRPPDPGRPRPGKEFGTLNLSSSPSRAEVYIDRYYYGLTPLTVDLSPRRYRVVIQSQGYAPFERDVQIRKDRTERLSVRLQRE